MELVKSHHLYIYYHQWSWLNLIIFTFIKKISQSISETFLEISNIKYKLSSSHIAVSNVMYFSLKRYI